MGKAAASLALMVAALCLSTRSAAQQTGLAPTCGTITLAHAAFQVEVTDGHPPCAAARSVLSRARFHERSRIGGWGCWQGTPAYGFTSVVDGCDHYRPWGQVEAVPVKALSRIGQACRLFVGPGDTGIHGYAFRVHGVSCAAAKAVVETCDTGTSCQIGTETWFCRQPKQKMALGFGERCTSGMRFTSIVWLD